MPLYEYQCATCDHAFEALVYTGDNVECPECHGAKLERLLSVPARPRTEVSSLPMNCDANLPPCNPNCCRL